MDVLDCHGSRVIPIGDQVEDRVEDSSPRPLNYRVLESAIHLERITPERAERPRGREIIARSPQDASIIAMTLRERLHQAGPADARFAADEGDGTGTVSCGQEGGI
jgi:hypothetical protein